MSFIIENFKLLNLLKKISGGIDKSKRKSLYNNILLKVINNKIFCISINDYLEIVAYDYLNKSFPSMEVIFDFSLIYNICKKTNLEDIIVLKKNRKYFEILAGNSIYKISRTFDVFPSFDYENFCIGKIKLQTTKLLESFRNVKVSISENNPQKFFNGFLITLNFNSLEGISSDGIRLSYFNIFGDVDISFKINSILPKTTVLEVLNIFNNDGEVYLFFYNNKIKFVTKKLTLTSKFIDDIYSVPLIDINFEFLKFIFDTFDFLNALEKIKILSLDSKIIFLSINNNKAFLRAGTSNENVIIFISNKNDKDVEFEIGFRYDYVLEIIKLFLNNEFEFIVNYNKTFIILKCYNSDFMHIVMPFSV